MQGKRDSLVPISEAFTGRAWLVKALSDASPQAVHHFTRFDQEGRLVGVSESGSPTLKNSGRTTLRSNQIEQMSIRVQIKVSGSMALSRRYYE